MHIAGTRRSVFSRLCPSVIRRISSLSPSETPKTLISRALTIARHPCRRRLCLMHDCGFRCYMTLQLWKSIKYRYFKSPTNSNTKGSRISAERRRPAPSQSNVTPTPKQIKASDWDSQSDRRHGPGLQFTRPIPASPLPASPPATAPRHTRKSPVADVDPWGCSVTPKHRLAAFITDQSHVPDEPDATLSASPRLSCCRPSDSVHSIYHSTVQYVQSICLPPCSRSTSPP
ncbi:uncharacterized protein EI97DRAFT_160778 [Westerdykella ornata]|uniref:Uncharacterized protein n=1 Tax=Westerdykella ornata TaxID=318751 RepID=A0A6A6J9N7_WESOR|nr:uncharacterized protein EI97DRAFT_160778 [Westerdykella ornata]KAF2273300.1 hypothetical protein EI97DRAFT_160778 [Westerdykella ornata]